MRARQNTIAINKINRASELVIELRVIFGSHIQQTTLVVSRKQCITQRDKSKQYNTKKNLVTFHLYSDESRL